MTRQMKAAGLVAMVVMVLAPQAAAAGRRAAPEHRAAAAARCPEYLFLGARGSGEPARTMGAAVQAEWEALRATLGSSVDIAANAVDYQAVPVVHDYRILGKKITFLDFQTPAYFASMSGGAGAIAGRISRCKKSKVILAGHSQGAHAVMTALPFVARKRILAVTLFGDPVFHAEGYATRGDFDPARNGLAAIPRVNPYPGSLRGRFYDYCHAHDPVCQGFVHCGWSSWLPHCDLDFSAHTHSTYKEEGDAAAAAANVARLIRDDQRAQGKDAPEPSPSSKGPVDVAFAIDTTGSMEPVIDSVSADVQAMAAQLAAVEPDYRLALVAYRDGGEYCDTDEYQTLTVQDFTADTAAFNAAVGSLVADGGCDDDESVYTGVMRAVELPWRPEATKVVIAVGDAPGHSPDPVTGYGAGDVIARAQSGSVAIYGLDAGDAFGTFSELTDATGGQTFTSGGADEIPAAIERAISAQATAPSAAVGDSATVATTARAAQAAGYSGPVGVPISFSAAASSSPLGRALTYAWDFDGDGTVDSEGDVPVVTHVYSAPFDGEAVLRVTDSAGQFAVRRVHVITGGQSVRRPAAPSRPKVTVKRRSLRVTWRRGRGGGKPVAWIVRNRRGGVLAIVGATKGARQSTKIRVRRLTRRTAPRIRVSAMNAAGDESRLSKPSRAGGKRKRHR